MRSYGYYKAHQAEPDMIVTLDDDCYPLEEGGRGFLDKHWKRLEEGGSEEAWQPSGIGVVTRGVPYYHTARKRTCVLNHGLWKRVPDFDAPTQLVQTRVNLPFDFENQTIPVGKYFQSLVVVTRTKTGFRRKEVLPVRFVPMTGKAQEAQ